MGDAEKVLDAVKDGPLPVHVVRQRTGLDSAEVVGVLAKLRAEGQITRAGEMVSLPDTGAMSEPSYQPLAEPDLGPNHPASGLLDEDEFAESGYDGPMLDGPDVPVPTVEAYAFLVATEWTEVRDEHAQAAADRVLTGDGEGPAESAALVVEVEHAQIFERATVTRPRAPR